MARDFLGFAAVNLRRVLLVGTALSGIAVFVSTILAMAILAGSPAHAACAPAAGAGPTPVAGTTVTCSGATTDGNFAAGSNIGYGTRDQVGLTINIDPGASVSATGAAGNPPYPTGIWVSHDNTINNSGTVSGAYAAVTLDDNGTITINNLIAASRFTSPRIAINGAAGTVNLTNYGTVESTGGGLGGSGGISTTVANVTNYGTISSATGNAIEAATITSLINSGTITGATIGVSAGGPGNSSITNSGTITGTGGTAIQFTGGSNTLTIAPTSVINGNVVAVAGDTFQLGGTGTATFDASTIGAAQQYRNFNVFNKVDSSIWTVNGTSTFTGATSVNAGTLAVNGDITSSSGVTVNTGGTLGGTGTLPTTTIASGGTLAPGNSIGTVNVTGNVTFNAGSTYAVEVSPSAADRTNATGTATLAGTVQATFASGNYSGRSYTILSATGGRIGTFDTLTAVNLPGGFTPSLSYTATDALLNLTASLGQSAGLSPNQQGVSTTINNFFNNGGTLPASFTTLFGLTGASLTNALTQISGEAGAGGGVQGGTQMMSSFLTLTLNPFGGAPGGNPGSVGFGRGFAAEQELSPEAAQAYAAVTPKDRLPSSTLDRRWGIWGQAYGGLNKTGGDTNAGTHDTTARTYGLATGADYHATPDLLLGFALAGGGTNYGLSDGLGGGHSDVFQIGVYGSKQFGAAYLSAALSYALHWMTTDRTVTVAGTDRLTADFNAHSFGGRLESGYLFNTAFVGITPYAALQVQNFRTPSYSETAASGSAAFALAYDAKSTTTTRTELGAWFDKVVALANGNALALRTRAAWAHDHSSGQGISAAFQTLPGAAFSVNGAAPVANSALLSAGGEFRLASGMSFGAKFDGEFANRSQTYAGTGTVRYVW